MQMDPERREEIIREFLRTTGIENLYPPQEEALPHIVRGKSVVVSAPTASGKTLIALMGMMNSLLNGEKCIYAVPLRALATEKYDEAREMLYAFHDFLREKGIDMDRPRIAMSIGEYQKSEDNLGANDIIIATSEKVDSIMRHGPEWVENIGVFIADEVHIIGDPGRGPTMEMILTHLRRKVRDMSVIALSATINNAEEIASWLKAELVKTTWRPVDLKLGVITPEEIILSSRKRKKLDISGIYEKSPRDLILHYAVKDAVENGFQILVFVSSRKRAEAAARKMADVVSKYLQEKEIKHLRRVSKGLMEGDDISSEKFSEKLRKVFVKGVAFHHAGLMQQQRNIVEKSFREGWIKCIVATPTLAAGVNLPSRRVLVLDYTRYDPTLGQHPISAMEMHQMLGRAGRPRYDPYGEGLIAAKSEDEAKFLLDEYIDGETEDIESQLGSNNALRSHVLAALSMARRPMSLSDITDLFSATFYGFTKDLYTLEDEILSILGFLIWEGMVLPEKGDKFSATRIGHEVSSLYLDPVSAAKIITGGRYLESLLGQGEDVTIELLFLLSSTMEMPAMGPKTAEKKGLRDMWFSDGGFIPELASILDEQVWSWREIEKYDFDEILERQKSRRFVSDPYYQPEAIELASFRQALILKQWIDEVPSDDICNAFDIGPGDLRYILDIAKWVSSAMARLYYVCSYPLVADRMEKLASRIEYGVKEDALPIVSLHGIGRTRARALFNAGYRDVSSLAKASVEELMRVQGIGKKLAADILRQLGAEIEDVEEDGKEESGQSTLMDFA